MSRYRRPHPRPDHVRPILRLLVEQLEARALLSLAADSGIVTPAVAAYLASTTQPADSTTIVPAITSRTPITGAMTPTQILRGYNFPTVANAGSGITIAIVNAYHNANIQSDLATFSAQYGLPAASLTVVNQYGSASPYPAVDSGWALETAMDVEWAHAIAPYAKIVLVEAKSANTNDLMTAVQTAARMANVVSMSWGGSEFSGQRTYDSSSYFANPSVTFVAASGDDGGASGASWPSSSPYVLSVGGTTLTVSSTGSYQGETAWSASGGRYGASGSTGGVSTVESLPSYQLTALGSRYASGRVTPDVAMDGNPSSGVSVYSGTSTGGQSGWFKVGGTSAGSPIWAALVAVADQGRRAAGLATLSSSQTLNLVYSLYGTAGVRAASYTSSFHDIVSGSNYAGSAVAGFDRVTGLGSPYASAIIAALSRSTSPAIRSTAGPTTTTTTLSTTVARNAAIDATVFAQVEPILATSDAAATLPFASVTTVSPAALTSVRGSALSLGSFGLGRALPRQPLDSSSLLGSSSVGDDETPVLPPPDAPRPAEPATEPGVGDFDHLPNTPAPDPIASAPEVWDTALDRLLVTDPAPFEAPAGDSVTDGSAMPMSDAPAPSPTAAAGIAALIWGVWEYQARTNLKGRRRSFLPQPSRN